MVGVVVDLGFSRPGLATIVGIADIDVGIATVRVLVKVAYIQSARMSGACRSHRRKRHWQYATAGLGRNGNKERGGVDAVISDDMGCPERLGAIRRLCRPDLLATVVFPGSVGASVGAGCGVYTDRSTRTSRCAALPVGNPIP